MMQRCGLLLVVLGAACGGPALVVHTAVRLDAQLAGEVTSLNVYAFGPERKDGVMLTCPTLMLGDVAPTDKRLDLLDSAVVAVSGGATVTLDEVAAGPNRLVYVEGKNAGGVVIANGCTEYIKVEEGASSEVEVDVYRLQ